MLLTESLKKQNQLLHNTASTLILIYVPSMYHCPAGILAKPLLIEAPVLGLIQLVYPTKTN